MNCGLEKLWHDADGTQWFLNTCPWPLLTAPALIEVHTAHKFFDKGQLLARYPNPPLALVKALEEYDNGLNRGQSDRLERLNQRSSKKA